MPSVRPESDADQARVHAIQAAAFGRAAEADLVTALRASEDPQVSLVAEHEGRVVGHVFVSPATLEGASPAPPLGVLGPIGVDPALQGRGIGSRLVRSALEASADLGWVAVFLVGNPAYYGRFGFTRSAPAFTYGDPHIDPALQHRELVGESLAGLRGRVIYPEAFADV